MWACLFGFIFYVSFVLYFRNKRNVFYRQEISRTHYRYIVFFLILYGVIGLCFGDFWGYGALVQKAYNTYLSYSGPDWDQYLHMEHLYNYLAVVCKGNYLMWRLIWFTVEFCGVAFILKRLSLNTYESLYIFSTCALYSICAGRVSWGIAFYWLGLYAFCKTREKKFLLFVFASFFSHNSILLLVALLPFLFIKISNKVILAVPIFIPSLSAIFSSTLNDLMLQLNMINSTDVEMLSRKLEEYQNAESFNLWGGSLGEFIQYLLARIPFYYMFILFLYKKIKREIVLTDSGQKIFNVMFMLFVYTCVILTARIGSASFYDRYLMMLYVPLYLLVYGEHKDNFIHRRDIKICLFLMFLSVVVSYLKSTYYYSIEDPTYRLYDF